MYVNRQIRWRNGIVLSKSHQGVEEERSAGDGEIIEWKTFEVNTRVV
jgi:hypothetical protein